MISLVLGKTKRTALLIRCSQEEAIAIRAAARKQSRTISAHLLRVVMQQIALKERLERQHDEMLRTHGLLPTRRDA